MGDDAAADERDDDDADDDHDDEDNDADAGQGVWRDAVSTIAAVTRLVAILIVMVEHILTTSHFDSYVTFTYIA